MTFGVFLFLVHAVLFLLALSWTGPDVGPDDDLLLTLWFRPLINLVLFSVWLGKCLRYYADFAWETCAEAIEEHLHRRCAPPPPPTEPSLRPGVPATFPQFSRLPPELRHAIWEMALPGPRLVMLTLPRHMTAPAPLLPLYCPRLRRCRSTEDDETPRPRILRSPALLAVCAESRAVAARRYRLGLAPAGCPQPRVYFDPARDVLVLPEPVVASPEGRALLRRMAVAPREGGESELGRVRRLLVAAGRAAGDGGWEDGWAAGARSGGGGADGWGPAGLAPGAGGRGRGAGEAFLASEEARSMLGRVESLALVRGSWMITQGVVSRWMERDWESWLECQEGKGRVKWLVGGSEWRREREWRWRRSSPAEGQEEETWLRGIADELKMLVVACVVGCVGTGCWSPKSVH